MDCGFGKYTINSIKFNEEDVYPLSDTFDWFLKNVDTSEYESLPSKKIINKDACILFFGDRKYIVRRMDGDKSDPEKAFLLAYFLAKSGLSRTKANKYIENIRQEYDVVEKEVKHIRVKKGH